VSNDEFRLTPPEKSFNGIMRDSFCRVCLTTA
jgi:hypothetical protein